MLKKLALILGALATLAVVAVLWMVKGVQRPGTFDVQPKQLQTQTQTQTATGTLTLLTWNIAWGYGWGSEGSGKKKTKQEIEEGLAKVGQAIADLHADVAVLQEVDLGADRSWRTQQAEIVAKRAGLPYVAEAVSWDANYLPFPYWPPSEHFGRMRSGGAILSRFPLERCRVELLPKPDSRNFVERLGYLFRYLQRCDAKLPDGRTLRVFNAHLEAFDKENRAAQAELVERSLEADLVPLTFFAGDFNTVPPEATRRHGFPDDAAVDDRTDTTLERLRAVPGLAEIPSPADYRAREAEWLTFPSHAPNRKLDYAFLGSGFTVVGARVAREVGTPSDHLPMRIEVR